MEAEGRKCEERLKSLVSDWPLSRLTLLWTVGVLPCPRRRAGPLSEGVFIAGAWWLQRRQGLGEMSTQKEIFIYCLLRVYTAGRWKEKPYLYPKGTV